MNGITYEQLFDTLRREKSRDELQELEADFYDMVKNFLAEKRTSAENSGDGLHSLTAQRAQIEYQNVQKILKELYERRERKIVTLALHHIRTESTVVDTDALQGPEKELFDKVAVILRESRSCVLSSVSRIPKPIIKPEPPEEEPEEPETTYGDTISHSEESDLVAVKFLAVVPKFVGKNMEVFGPFQEGDRTSLPDDVAQILIKKGRAELLEAPQQV